MNKKIDLITYLSRSLKNRNKRIDYEDSFTIDIQKDSFFGRIWESGCTALEIKSKNYMDRGYCRVNLNAHETVYYDKYEALRVIGLILLTPTEKYMRDYLNMKDWRIFRVIQIEREKKKMTLSDYPDTIQRLIFSIINVSEAETLSVHPSHFEYGAIYNPVQRLRRNNDDDDDDKKSACVHKYALRSSVGTPFGMCDNHTLKLNLFIAMLITTQMPTSDLTKGSYILDILPVVIDAIREPKRINELARYLEPINNKEGWLEEMRKLASFEHKDKKPERHNISLSVWEAANALPNDIDFVRRHWFLPSFETKKPTVVKIEYIPSYGVIECLKQRPCINIVRRDIAIHQENLFTSVTLENSTDQKLSIVYLKIDNTSQVALFDLWSTAFTKYGGENYLFRLLHYVWARPFLSQTHSEQTIVITYQFVFDILNCFVYKYNNHINPKSVFGNSLHMLIARTASIVYSVHPLFKKETSIFNRTINELLYLIIEGPMYEHAFCRDAKDSRNQLVRSLKGVITIQCEQWYKDFETYNCYRLDGPSFKTWYEKHQDQIGNIFRLWRAALASSRNIKFKNNTEFVDKLLEHMGETCVSHVIKKLLSDKVLEEVRSGEEPFYSWWEVLTRLCKGSESDFNDESNGWTLMRMSSSCTYIEEEEEQKEEKQNIPGVPDSFEQDDDLKFVPSFPMCTDKWFEKGRNIFRAYICMVNIYALICAVNEVDNEIVTLEEDFVELMFPDNVVPFIRNKKQIVMGYVDQRPFYSDDATMTNQSCIDSKYYSKELYPLFRVWKPGSVGRKNFNRFFGLGENYPLTSLN